MAATTLCPKCTQAVSLPDQAESAAEVRCPLCLAEYPLAEALPEGVPALIVLGAAEIATLDASAFGLDAELAAAELAGSPDETTYGEPLAGDLQDLDFTSVEGDDAGDITATAEEHSEALPELTESEAAASDEEVTWETIPEEHGQPEENTFDGAANTAADTSVGTTVSSRSATQKRKRRGPGMVGQFIGIAVFGMIGIILGYGILKWMKAPAAAEIDKQIASFLPWWGSSTPAPTGNTPSEGGIVAPGSFVDPNHQLPAEKQPEKVPDFQPQQPGQNQPGEKDIVDAPPVAPPEPAEVPFDGPVVVKTVTSAQFDAAITTAKSEVDKKTQEVSPGEFKALCDLGNAVALVEDPAGPRSGELRRTAAVLLRNASAASRREKLGYYAHVWLFDNRRPPDRPGVWLVGRIEQIAPLKTAKGNLVETRIAVRGKTETATISVLSMERPDYRVGDTAGILGTIVTEPSTNLPWYTGDEPRVVLSGVALGLPGK